MKKFSLRLVSALLCLMLVLSLPKTTAAYTPGAAYHKDLSTWIQNDQNRRYVEMMLDYHVRTNSEVQSALQGGFSAVFLFDGCSDHMDDPELSDLSYYRVSGICIALRMNDAGEVEMVYFNDNASTIPDRPLEYGAWYIPEVGAVGPATILDGTYQLYSVYHKGNYEALHVRSDYQDETLDAVYMTLEGYTSYRANEINIHTRTSNHTSGRGMWSAGCPLVGDGDGWEYRKLIEATYYRSYDTFETGNFVGSLTIDRQALRTEMYTLYKNPDAVDAMLASTMAIQPQTYLERCGHGETYTQEKTLRVLMDTQLMTLPCSNASDARSVPLGTLSQGQTLNATGSIFNSLGNLWYETQWEGQRCYVYAGHVEERGTGIWNRFLGKIKISTGYPVDIFIR